jgi:hypothetical protein
MNSFYPLDFARRSVRMSRWAGAPERQPGWGVMATLREPVQLAAAFVCHHLDAGATKITLFFDDPDDPAIDIVSQFDRVQVIRCDAAHWRRLATERPATHYLRQIRNAEHASKATETEWLFHLDADEFLYMPDGILPDLAPLGRRTRWLRVPVAERIWDGSIREDELFGGVFRQPLPGGAADVDRLYGAGHEHLYPEGMSGHPFGKALMRTDRPLAPKIHVVNHHRTGRRLSFRQARHITLLHFDGLSKCHWALKHLRQVGRLMSGDTVYRGARRAITVDIFNADDPLARAFEWYDTVNRLDPATLARLRAAGGLLEVDPQIADTTARLLPGLPFEFTAHAIDAQLTDRVEAALAELRVARRTTTFS